MFKIKLMKILLNTNGYYGEKLKMNEIYQNTVNLIKSLSEEKLKIARRMGSHERIIFT